MFALKQWALASVPVIAERPALTNILMGSLVMAGVLLQAARGRLRRPLYPLQAWLIVILLVYALISVTWAPQFELSIGRWRDAAPYLVTIVFLAPLAVQDRSGLHVAFSGTLVLGTVIALLLLFFAEWEGRQVIISRTVDPEAGQGNPLVIGQLGGTLVLLGVLYRTQARARLFQALKVLAVVVGLALVARSGSRGQLAGAVIVAAAFWALVNPSQRGLKQLIGLSIAIVLIALTKLGMDLLWANDQRFSVAGIEGDYAGRLQNALTLLRFWSDSPLTIIFGLGNSASYDPKVLGIYPHIVPLEVLGEEGIIGFLVLAAIIVLTIGASRRVLQECRQDAEARRLFACIAGLWFYTFLLINKQGSLLLSHDFLFYTILVGRFAQIVNVGAGPEEIAKIDRRPANLLA